MDKKTYYCVTIPHGHDPEKWRNTASFRFWTFDEALDFIRAWGNGAAFTRDVFKEGIVTIMKGETDNDGGKYGE